MKNVVHNSTGPEQKNQEYIAQILYEEKVLVNIDDTPCPRNGSHIEVSGIHHEANGFVKRLCVEQQSSKGTASDLPNSSIRYKESIC